MRKVIESAIRSELDHVRKPTMRCEEFPYFICGEGGRSGFPVDRTTSHLWQQERLSLHSPFLYLVLYLIGEGPYILLKSIY